VGRPYGVDKARRLARLHEFYSTQSTRGLLPENKPACTNLSKPKVYAAAQLSTNYSTNVQQHFDKYVRRLVDVELTTAAKAELGVDSLPKDVKCRIASDVRAVTRDLLEAPSEPTCREGLRAWVEQNRAQLVPPRPKTDATERHWRFLDRMTDPHRWVPYMVWINSRLENTGARLMSPLPQKTGFIPGHIRLDTAGLIDLIVPDAERTLLLKAELEGMDMPAVVGDVGPVKYDLPGLLLGKGQLYVDLAHLVSLSLVARVKSDPIRHAASFKTAIWMCLTKLGRTTHVPTTYYDDKVFDNLIDTDSVSVSIHYVSSSLFGVTRFNGGSKKLKAAQKAHAQKEKAKGSVYVTDLSDNDRIAILCDGSKKVASDPGKACIAKLTDGSGAALSYTSAQRRVESGSKAYAERRGRMLDVPLRGLQGGHAGRSAGTLQSSIGKVHTDAGPVTRSSKSTILEHYEHYLRTRLLVAEDLKTFYNRAVFRIMRHDVFVGRRASEERFFSKAKATFGVDACILYGDWGRNPNLKHQPPSPGIGFRRRMCSHFRVLLVHEAYTSSVCPRCKTRGMTHPRTDSRIKEIHHLLLCPNLGCSCPWWNRDILGALNILKTGMHALRTGSWDPAFTGATGAA